MSLLQGPLYAQNNIVAQAECPGGLGIYLTAKNKVYLGVPDDLMGRKFLIGGAVSSISDPGAANIGQKASGPLQCIIPSLEDSLVVISRPQVAGSSPDSSMQKAMQRNFSAPVLRRTTALRRNGRVLFDITIFVTQAAPKGKEFKAGNEDGTCWYEGLKAFEDNASIRLYQTLDANGLGGKSTVSMVSTVSVLALPREPMRPRVQDSRIGTFSTGSQSGGNRFELSPAHDGLHPYRLANRWRVEPADEQAWSRGETVPVKNPIVWWLDDSFPEVWKPAIKQGVLAWNAAFETIGLKDVLQVRDFPEGDSSFDPDNLKYNCIRYVPNATANAMGPSWADPETGEIVSATVLLFHDVVKLLNNWRFVQTAQVDERVRCRKMPDEVIAEALIYAVSHEIGHTLGLLHNMAGSAAIPVDSLRSPSYTAVHGTTASIMDYARFNYVAQPEDKGVRLVPPPLGEYDKYAIAWLYKPVPEAGDCWEESALAQAVVDSHEGDPFYRYGPQQSSMAPVQQDPSARTQDLGDDPLRAGDYGISNLRYILRNMEVWVQDDPDYSHRRRLYEQMIQQYQRYLNHAQAQIGGIYLTRTRSGLPCIPVPASRQQASLAWVVKQVAQSEWLDAPSLTVHFGLHASESARVAASVGRYLAVSAPLAVATASVNGSEYGTEAYFDDLFRCVFHRGRYTLAEKALQRALVQSLCTANSTAVPPASTTTLDDMCFGEDQSPQQASVDVSASAETSAFRLVFLKRVKRMAEKQHGQAHFDYLYSLLAKI